MVKTNQVWATSLVLLVLIGMVLAGGWAAVAVADQWDGRRLEAVEATSSVVATVPTETSSPPPPPAPPTPLPSWQLELAPDQLASQAGVVYDLNLQQIIWAYQADQLRAPASLVKIMTTLVAIEQLPELDKTVIVAPQVLQIMRQQGAALAGFAAGEVVTVRDLLYGTMLASGGESSWLLAELVGGQASMVALMNRKASELGLINTKFTNVIGLDQSGQVTTAQDVAKLLAAALTNSLFREIFTTRDYLYQTPQRQLKITSTLFSRLPNYQLGQLTILGGKTGTTGQAGLCLATLAAQGQREVLIITLGAPLDAWPQPSPRHVADLILTAQQLRLNPTLSTAN